MEGLLANWMWQGCAIALAAAAVLRASRRMSATTRYHIWWIAMAIVLVLPASSLQLPAVGFEPPASSVQHGALSVQPADGAPKVLVLPALPTWTGALLVFMWSAWAATSLSRTMAALVTLRASQTLRPTIPRSPRSPAREVALATRTRSSRPVECVG